MSNQEPKRIAEVTASERYRDVQRIQSEYRERLLADWQVPPGAKVLEVGCGQGDMTALLARAVGSSGQVVAVDIADPAYGAPLTLGEATALLKASPVGPQIDFRFHFDVLAAEHSFPDGYFDCAVLAHSSWYFESPQQLAQTFAKLKTWARRLCFAEWDMEPHHVAQTPHMLAVLIQGQVEAFKPESQANVRTPLSRKKLRWLLEETGWSIETERWIDTDALQDADWEIAACQAASLDEARALGLTPKFLSLLESQIDLLDGMASPTGNRPLPAYSIVAKG